MKKRLFFYLIPLLFLSCSDSGLSGEDYPEAKTELHNALNSKVEIVFGVDFESRITIINPGVSQPFDMPFFYVQNSHYDGVHHMSMRFANGKVKTDWDCASFIYSPSLLTICGQDSISIYRKENYTSHIEGNDTIYRYYIGIADSLEAN